MATMREKALLQPLTTHVSPSQIGFYFLLSFGKYKFVQFELLKFVCEIWCYERFINLSSVLSSGPVSDSPLEVGLGVSLDEGVDGADTSMSLGGVVDGLGVVSGGRGSVSRSVPPHPQHGLSTWTVSV